MSSSRCDESTAAVVPGKKEGAHGLLACRFISDAMRWRSTSWPDLSWLVGAATAACVLMFWLSQSKSALVSPSLGYMMAEYDSSPR